MNTDKKDLGVFHQGFYPKISVHPCLSVVVFDLRNTFLDVRELRATLPRHWTLDKIYVEEAIKRIDRLLELKKGL